MLMQPRRNRNERVKLNSEQMNKLEQGLEKILFKNMLWDNTYVTRIYKMACEWYN